MYCYYYTLRVSEWAGKGQRSIPTGDDDDDAMVRPVIVGFWELSVILSCHANFIKFIMVLHTFWCAPRGVPAMMRCGEGGRRPSSE